MLDYNVAAYYYNKITSSAKSVHNTFASEYDGARLNFSGATKKQLHYFILNSSDANTLNTLDYKQWIQSFFKEYPRDTLTTILKYKYSIESVALKKLKKGNVFDEELFTVDGKLIKWRDILLRNKGKVILIDFWAKFCGPCVYELPFSQRLEKDFKDKDMVFIYVSLDVSKETWLEAMNELHFQQKTNSYLRVLQSSMGLMEYYHTKYIPKYVIYDKEGLIVNNDAPRPSNDSLKNLLNKLVDSN